MSAVAETLPKLDTEVSEADLEKIGVRRRGWAGEGESIAEMAAHASRRALEQAGVSPESVDFIVLANWTQRRYIPEHAPPAVNSARPVLPFSVIW